MQKGRKIAKRIAVIFLALFLMIAVIFGLGWFGALCADLSWGRWRPDYQKEDISSLLSKTELTEEEYTKIYRQTGLTKVAVDDCLSQGKQDRILRIQEAFFQSVELYKTCYAPFTYIETISGNIPLALLQDGDILISASTRVSFFRYGHAALVVDGEYGRILEALEPGSKSKMAAATTFSNLANFLVLRPKADVEIRCGVAEAAIRDLVGIEYSLTAGIFGDKYQEIPSSTQCAHLVWTAYKRYGIDLDRNGGSVVKPQDFLSDKVDVVQVYGFDLDTLWR